MRKPEIQKWIDGLRSNKYEQVVGTILDEGTGRMCCLGVLGVVNGMFVVNDGFKDAVNIGYDYARDLLGETAKNKCQVFNDLDKLTFSEIADKVEEMFPNA